MINFCDLAYTESVEWPSGYKGGTLEPDILESYPP